MTFGFWRHLGVGGARAARGGAAGREVAADAVRQNYRYSNSPSSNLETCE